MNEMNCESGPFNCPRIYCMAIIIPSVMSPSMTALTARNDTTMFFVCEMNNAPTSCVWPKVRLLMLILNRRAWMRSHSQRF